MKSILIALSFLSVQCRLYELSDSNSTLNCLSNDTCNTVAGTNDFCCGLATVKGYSYNYTQCLSVDQAGTYENYNNFTYYFSCLPSTV